MQEWEAFKDTWPAFEARNPDHVDTDSIRQGWAKPTIYTEHEVIHLLASALDKTRVIAATLEAQRDDFAENLREAHVNLARLEVELNSWRAEALEHRRNCE